MFSKLRKLLPAGKLLLLLPLILMLLFVSCGEAVNTILEDGSVEDAILNYIDENVDDYNEPAADSTDAESSATELSAQSPETEPQQETEPVQVTETQPDLVETEAAIDENGSYTTKEDVALYIHTYSKLPSNFITKSEAEKLGWEGGSLEPYAPGKCIGGNKFGNYEGLLPKKDGRTYTECDIDTLGADKRGAKRIVFSNDGLIYYTEDHYESFELLYGDPES